MKDNGLKAYWFTFPENPEYPIGFGVTAYSAADAYSLLESNGYEFHVHAKRVSVRENVSASEIEPNHVRKNMGPIVTRGVWYPALNVGFGAPYGGKSHV